MRDQLLRELKTLRKGLGLTAPDLLGKVGPTLRQAAGVQPDDTSGMARRKVVKLISDVTYYLPDVQRWMAGVMFSLPSYTEFVGLSYTSRLTEAGMRIDRDLRTMQRQADRVLQKIAEDASEHIERVDDVDWYTDALRIALLLDTERATVYEARRIVAVDELEHIDLHLNVDPHQFEQGLVDVDVLYGGELDTDEDSYTDRVVARIHLPGLVLPGETHDIGLLHRLPTHTLHTQHVCIPTAPCNYLEMMVRFHPNNPPTDLSLIDGTPTTTPTTNQPPPHTEQLDIDERGTTRATFGNPTPGHAYGIRWTTPPPITYHFN